MNKSFNLFITILIILSYQTESVLLYSAPIQLAPMSMMNPKDPDFQQVILTSSVEWLNDHSWANIGPLMETLTSQVRHVMSAEGAGIIIYFTQNDIYYLIPSDKKAGANWTKKEELSNDNTSVYKTNMVLISGLITDLDLALVLAGCNTLTRQTLEDYIQEVMDLGIVNESNIQSFIKILRLIFKGPSDEFEAKKRIVLNYLKTIERSDKCLEVTLMLLEKMEINISQSPEMGGLNGYRGLEQLTKTVETFKTGQALLSPFFLAGIAIEVANLSSPINLDTILIEEVLPRVEQYRDTPIIPPEALRIIQEEIYRERGLDGYTEARGGVDPALQEPKALVKADLPKVKIIGAPPATADDVYRDNPYALIAVIRQAVIVSVGTKKIDNIKLDEALTRMQDQKWFTGENRDKIINTLSWVFSRKKYIQAFLDALTGAEISENILESYAIMGKIENNLPKKIKKNSKVERILFNAAFKGLLTLETAKEFAELVKDAYSKKFKINMLEAAVNSGNMNIAALKEIFRTYAEIRSYERRALWATVYGFRSVFDKDENTGGSTESDFIGAIWKLFATVFIAFPYFGLMLYLLGKGFSSEQMDLLVAIVSSIFSFITILSMQKLPTQLISDRIVYRQLDQNAGKLTDQIHPASANPLILTNIFSFKKGEKWQTRSRLALERFTKYITFCKALPLDLSDREAAILIKDEFDFDFDVDALFPVGQLRIADQTRLELPPASEAFVDHYLEQLALSEIKKELSLSRPQAVEPSYVRASA
ncbi:MAG: hypothetical protein JW774_13525 [Candidatus Aureabacteria bacterium]|nr:hypothetical protein [Candidatus Auribacterota bacterium]